MSHFYGEMQGNRGKSTRCGTKKSGMESYVASYKGAIRCYAYVDSKGRDRVRVEKTIWFGAGKYMPIYDGPID